MISKYLQSVRQELKHVTWPTKKDTVMYTLVVIVVSFLVAVFLGGVDATLKSLLKLFIGN